MKRSLLLSLTTLFLLFVTPSFGVHSTPKPVDKDAVEKAAVNADDAAVAKEEWDKLSKKEKRAKKKELRKSLKKDLKAASNESTLLLVIIAILLPPLAMAIYDGITNRFWISLLLTLLGYLPGQIYTLYIILSER